MLDDVAFFLNVSAGLHSGAAAIDTRDGRPSQASAFRFVRHGNITYEVILGDEFRPSIPASERQRLVIVFRP